MTLLLPKINIKNQYLSLFIEFGFSNSNCDFDNPIKPFVDILQKKYGFNDRQIMHASIHKKIVKKGNEYIKFRIDEYIKPTGL